LHLLPGSFHLLPIPRFGVARPAMSFVFPFTLFLSIWDLILRIRQKKISLPIATWASARRCSQA
jgi:hypothetical protein